MKWRSKGFGALVAASLLVSPLGGAQVKQTRRVLILYEAGVSFPAIALSDREIRAGLDKSPYQIEIYSEYLETSLFPEESSQKKFRKWYIRKYRDRRPDVIIAVGPGPIAFMVDAHERFFPNVPIVVCGSSEDEAGNPKLDAHFTGAWFRLDPAKTLEAALQLQPRTRQVVVVGGVSPYDRPLEAIVRDSLRSYERRLKITYLTNLDLPTLLERLKHLPKDTIVFYTSLSQDAAGTHFVDPTQSLPMVVGVANAPVFVMSDTFVGQGAVGGYVISFAVEARRAAEIATRILKGEKPRDISILRSTSVYMFDWRALQHWGFQENALPPGSVVLRRQPTIWEAYNRYVISGISLFLAETLLIFGLMWQRSKRRRIERSLSEELRFESLLSDLSTTFINLPESQVDSNIEKGLSRIGEFLRVDRITVHLFSEDRTELKVTFLWRNEGVVGLPAVVRAHQFPWWTKRLLQGQVVLVSDVNALPVEASSEKEYLRKIENLSLATVPLEVRGEIFGSISFSSTKRRMFWAENVVQQLRVFAEILSNAITRKRSTHVLLASIAELKRIGAALRESEERFRLVANTAPVLIWMSGTDKLCTYFNQPWLDFTGRTLEAEEGNGWTQGVHSEDFSRCLETFVQAFDRREAFEMEYRLRRFDGVYRWVVDRGVPRFNSDGSFAGYIGSAIDVTERKLAQEALAGVGGKLIDAQEKERTRIARELHDDINQRLALLAIKLEELAKDPSAYDGKLSHHIHELGELAIEIGSEVQAISHRLHSSKLEYLGLLSAVQGFCREFSEQQKVEIDFSHDDIPRTLPPDISLCVFRVLQEALQNAVKHSGVRHFEVELFAQQGEVSLVVRDSGIGFDLEAAAKDPGLGLISMRERVSLVSGSISITSKPKCGTEINVRIPIAVAAGPSSMKLPSETVRGEYGMSADLAS